MLTLDTPVASFGPAIKRRAALLKELGIVTVRDALLHFPSRHEDFRSGTQIADIVMDTNVIITAEVAKVRAVPRFGRRMSRTEVVLTDGSGTIKAVWFNQPYRAKSMPEGRAFRFAGKVTAGKYGVQMVNPQVEPLREATGASDADGSDLLPVYSTTNGVTQQLLRLIMRNALPAASLLPDPLPEHLREQHGLLSIADAVREAHYPTNAAGAANARKRIGFDEMLRVQLSVGRMRRLRQSRRAPQIPTDREGSREFVQSLPFEITEDQRTAAWAALQDMESGRQMHRMLDGDVGSGKTLVAAIAMLNVARAGLQAAIMAPTEILATQHYATLSRLYDGQPFAVAIWTQSYKKVIRWGASAGKFAGKEIVCKSKAEVEALGREIADGDVQVIVGTHALVEDALQFRALALAVVDEQHRFGVRLRSQLVGKSGLPDMEPHLLSMTATPIPRSLALAMFGDLDLSLLRQKPKGRIEIETSVYSSKQRGGAYAAVREQIAEGRQAFVVCPLIDPSDTLGALSVTEAYDELRAGELKGIKLGVLHGKLPAAEKEKVMADFLAAKIQVLVSTSVVEVGVDVPNATVMCIEGAERFGLSQLHQFRGRIGRGVHKSYCFLLPSSMSASTKERMKALEKNADGFSLAEIDLKMRGPGDVLGTTQSGFPELLMASFADARLIADAKAAAEALLAEDPDLERHPALKESLRTAAERVHLE